MDHHDDDETSTTMSASKNACHQLEDDLLSTNLHPSVNVNQLDNDNEALVDVTQSKDHTERLAGMASPTKESAHPFETTELFHSPFPTNDSLPSYSDERLLFPTSPWFLSRQCSPFLRQQSPLASLLDDLASTTTTPPSFAPLPVPHSTFKSYHSASLEDKTPSGLKPAPKNPTTSENEQITVAEALLGLHTQSRKHVDNKVPGARDAVEEVSKLSCKCKNSQCLKLYCSCIRAGVHCTDGLCKCKNCNNIASPPLSPSNHPKNCSCSLCSSLVYKKLQEVCQNTSETNQGCNCKSSLHCLKLYCPCFRSGHLCNVERCTCRGCKNTANEESSGIRREAVKACLKRRLDAFDVSPRTTNLTVCSCKKTRCLLKYCVCFANDLTCTTACSCLDCKNQSNDVSS